MTAYVPDVVENAVAVVHEVEVRRRVLPDVALEGAVVQLVQVGGDLVVEDVVVPLRHLQVGFGTCELVCPYFSCVKQDQPEEVCSTVEQTSSGFPRIKTFIK